MLLQTFYQLLLILQFFLHSFMVVCDFLNLLFQIFGQNYAFGQGCFVLILQYLNLKPEFIPNFIFFLRMCLLNNIGGFILLLL